ncbi:PREDICTED: cilia- and flagella-associated protein 36 [Nicrophorus vespilloides]|uniref:Cilia- and flagella-associated protein 36 n=1 Tax=Nicrophorus vespilloides TaxID=110193 RepID=A0ABM1MG83_NICVS|nr:PREDICTED: cilia- and flagella-associated protein 36 [Nicrophorus vespilloides]
MAEEDCWVFDSLVAFLNGPVWNAPLQSFIEERSLIFEPNDAEHPEYKKAFDDFKNLVDFMLGNFMEDIGISPQQFEAACFRGAKEAVPLHFDPNTFEQIWAANDYQMFKRMMAQKNVELQLQALELIEHKYGKTPELFIPKGREGESSAAVEIVKSSDLEREILEEVSKQFPIEKTEEVEVEEEINYLHKEKFNLEETLKKTIEDKLTTQKAVLEKQLDETDEEEEMIKPERTTFDLKQKQEVDNVELKKRQDYLRTQRDKLVALKKEARKKHLDDGGELKGKKVRPKSAKAAEVLMSSEPGSHIEPQKLKLRKALVQKLKTEVVGKNSN